MPSILHFVRGNRVVDRARHGGIGSLVEHHGGASDDRRDFLVVADIGALEVDVVAHIVEVLSWPVSRLSMTTTFAAPSS